MNAFFEAAMAEQKNNFYTLESIIKVEPEEFQETNRIPDSRQFADDILRSKAKM